MSPNLPLFGGGISSLSIAKSWLCAKTLATASNLPIDNNFVLQKVPPSENSDDAIACGLPPPPIKNPGYAYAWAP